MPVVNVAGKYSQVIELGPLRRHVPITRYCAKFNAFRHPRLLAPPQHSVHGQIQSCLPLQQRWSGDCRLSRFSEARRHHFTMNTLLLASDTTARRQPAGSASNGRLGSSELHMRPLRILMVHYFTASMPGRPCLYLDPSSACLKIPTSSRASPKSCSKLYRHSLDGSSGDVNECFKHAIPTLHRQLSMVLEAWLSQHPAMVRGC